MFVLVKAKWFTNILQIYVYNQILINIQLTVCKFLLDLRGTYDLVMVARITAYF
jgi:hypothetical protein